jgi:uncharacterized protein YgfB (UPF0149 family)
MAEAKNQHISEHVLGISLNDPSYSDKNITIDELISDVENTRYKNIDITQDVTTSEERSTIYSE